MRPGRVCLVGAGPGDPGLLTVRALERLREAEVVVYDRLVNPTILDEAPPEALRIFAGKRVGSHCLPQAAINALLVHHAEAGRFVVRLKGGDPFVFGRGGEEALALSKAGIAFEVVPGISSAIAVPAYAGIPVTHRGIASSFAVLTGHEDPSKDGDAVDWTRLATAVDTLVVLMAAPSRACPPRPANAHGTASLCSSWRRSPTSRRRSVKGARLSRWLVTSPRKRLREDTPAPSTPADWLRCVAQHSIG